MDKAHGRLEKRTIRLTTTLTKQGFKGMKQGFELTRPTEVEVYARSEENLYQPYRTSEPHDPHVHAPVDPVD